MSIHIQVPASGESISSASVSRWHKQDGDTVSKGETLVTLDTDKISTEVESPADGVLHITASEGEEVPIGSTIATLEAAAPPEPSAQQTADKPIASEPSATPQDRVKITIPPAGESITSATIGAWRVEDGAGVKAGDALVTIETDKVSNELEAPIGGVIRILAQEGAESPIGACIAEIEPAGASSSTRPIIPAQPSRPQQKPAQHAPVAKPTAPSAPADPVEPSEPKKPDFTAALQSTKTASAPEPVSDGRTTRRKMTTLRRKIATQLVNAQHTAAILTTFNEADLSGVMEVRKTVQETFTAKHGVKLGFMSFFVKAVVQALKEVPSLNARIEGDEIVENHFFDIGVAIGTEKGLVVPVLRDCDAKSLAEIERDILDYAEKARVGKIALADLQGGIFTISNGGTYGSLLSTPILNPPQSGILGMHAIQNRPVAVDGQVVIRPMMYLALSYDHRLVDGKDAVTFLVNVKKSIESPLLLLL